MNIKISDAFRRPVPNTDRYPGANPPRLAMSASSSTLSRHDLQRIVAAMVD